MYQPQSPEVLEDFLTVEPSFLLARKSRRWWAAVIDYLIIWILAFTVIYCFGEVTTYADGSMTYTLTGWPSFFSYFIPWLVLLPLMEAINNGQTLGKMILRLRVADMAGNKMEASSAFVRHLLDVVDYLPFFGIIGLWVAGSSKNSQRVGDIVAKTIVIQA